MQEEGYSHGDRRVIRDGETLTLRKTPYAGCGISSKAPLTIGALGEKVVSSRAVVQAVSL